MPHPTFPSLPPVAGGIAAAGALAALFGTYWDDAWHTDEGRDAFFIAPHLTLYAGVLVSGLVVVAWLLAGWRAQRWDVGATAAALRRAPAAGLALVGAAVTFTSAPIDDVWHGLYGRDAVIWSPPHMLGVAGSASLAVGLLAGAARGGPGAAAVRTLLAAGVLGSLLVPVLEFDSDVPQFPAWTYWPAATAGVVLFLLVLRDLVPGPWAATRVAAIYTVAKAAIATALAGMDHSPTVVPLVLLPAVVDDALHRREGTAAWHRAAAAAVTVPGALWLAALLQPDAATAVPSDGVPIALVASLLAAVAVGVVAGHVALPRPRPAAAAALLALATATVLLQARPAAAHDPGQGPLAGQVQLVAERSADRITVQATIDSDGSCRDLRPGDLVARRAGDVRRSPLTLVDCQASGTVPVSEGRWFVYVELRDRGSGGPEPVRYESWLAVPAGIGRTGEVRDLYVARDAATGPTSAQALSGTALYLVIASLVVAVPRLARAAGSPGGPDDGAGGGDAAPGRRAVGRAIRT